MENQKMEILAKFLRQKESKHPVSGEPLSKKRRIIEMFNIVINNIYDKSYTKTERILASNLITQILEED